MSEDNEGPFIDLDFNTAEPSTPPGPKYEEDPEARFLDEVYALCGGQPKPGFPRDQIVRFAVKDDGNRKESGWAVLTSCGRFGHFGDWRSGAKGKWEAGAVGAMPPWEAQEARARAKALADEERARKAHVAARTASSILETWPRVAGHQYLQAKGVRTYPGMRSYQDCLFIPVYTGEPGNGTLVGGQRIYPDGRKRFLPGTAMKGGHYYVGKPSASQVVICEGFATAATIHERTGEWVVCAFNAGNLKNVGRALRKVSPSLKIIYAADNDESGVGFTAAEAACVMTGGQVIVPKERGDFNDHPDELGRFFSIGSDPAPVERSAEEPKQETYRRETGAQIEIVEGQRTNDFLEDVLGYGQMTVVYGESNSGKTFFLLDLCAHIAAGIEWRGRGVEGGGVLYVGLEGKQGISKRYTALVHKFQEEYDVDLRQAPMHFILQDQMTFMNEQDVGKLARTIEEMIEEIEEPVRLVVIDTLARAMMGGNENTAEDMGKLVWLCDHLRIATGAHVVFIHHSGKDAAKGARGSSALRAATDTEIEIIPPADEDVEKVHAAIVRKQREFESKGVEWGFKLAQHVLYREHKFGKDREVTTCTVSEAIYTRRQVQGIGDNQGEILKALREAGRAMTSQELSDITGISLRRVRESCNLMVDRGVVTKTHTEDAQGAMKAVSWGLA